MKRSGWDRLTPDIDSVMNDTNTIITVNKKTFHGLVLLMTEGKLA